mmetsp:Transcript_16420/g.33027  ORF Transcript_16420/g.33027 Transcript_16420/m.33027 type:complete len:216 (-) Transcript_16420:404-1051(-)
MASGEKTPLIGDSAGSGGGSGQNPSYYFLQRAESTNKGAGDDGGEVVELPPEGANSSEFDSRPVATRGRASKSTPKKQGFFGGLFSGFGKGGAPQSNQGKRIATKADILRQRQGAIKVEPKVFFANERTFLAWLHCSVLLAGASIAIMSFSETNMAGQLYGVILLPVAIAFMTYAMSQCEYFTCGITVFSHACMCACLLILMAFSFAVEYCVIEK